MNAQELFKGLGSAETPYLIRSEDICSHWQMSLTTIPKVISQTEIEDRVLGGEMFKILFFNEALDEIITT
mgnify:CR=1 FL=1